MVMNIIGLNSISYDEFIVVDGSGNGVVGLTNTDFTKVLYNPTGTEVSATVIPIVSELGNGLYRVSFTPNAVGNWAIKITEATYVPTGYVENYVCQEGGVLSADEIADSVWNENITEHLTGFRAGQYLNKAATEANGGGGNITYYTDSLSKEEKEKLLLDIKSVLEILSKMKKIDDSINSLKTYLTPNNTIEESLLDVKEKISKISFPDYNEKLDLLINVLDNIKSDVSTSTKLLAKRATDEELEDVINDAK
jgi:hypothetical protein